MLYLFFSAPWIHFDDLWNKYEQFLWGIVDDCNKGTKDSKVVNIVLSTKMNCILGFS
jgi:hypothetical protein